LSRPDLIKELKLKHPKLTKIQTEIVIDTFFETIIKALKEGKNCQIRGFGNFYLKLIKENYNSRNPKTGRLIYVPKRNKVRFRIGKQFKQFLNQ
jgi:nucleoid DNA-binding protein